MLKMNSSKIEANRSVSKGYRQLYYDITDVEKRAKLLEDGADVNAYNYKGHTVLRDMARRSEYDIVNYLLDNGADPNIMAFSGRTALHCAVKNLDAKMVKLLLSRGADPTIKSNSGHTALDEAKYLLVEAPEMEEVIYAFD